jgi:DNA polymerase-3 subunit gamma/tau
VKLVSFTRGKIDISFNEKLNKNFIKLLTEKLLVWTHERWIISLSKNDSAKTVYEKNLEKKSAIILKEKDSELAKKFMSAFPDAELVDVKDEDA